MTLRAKLLLAQAPLAIVLALLGFGAVRTLARLGEHSQGILKDNYRSVLAAQRMKDAIERVDSAALFMVAGQVDRAHGQAELNEKKFSDELEAQERNITEAGEQDATATLHLLWTEYLEEYRKFTGITDRAAAERTYFTAMEPLFVRVKEAAEKILTLNQDAMVRKSDAAERAAQRMVTLMIVSALGALLLGVFSSTSLTARLLRPLFALSSAVRRLGEGDVEVRAPVVGQDELADLAREFNMMTERLARYRRSSLGELFQAQQSSQAAIDSLPDPVVIFGERGDVLTSNRAAAELFGIALEVDVAEPLAKAPTAIRETLERLRAHVLGGKGAYTPTGFEEAIRVGMSSGERAFLPRASPVHAEEGGLMGAAVVFQDVTKLLFFDQFKNDMVATVAHEFRTPLTSLHMAIHLCLEEAAGPVTDKQAQLLHAAREDCQRLQDIVDDLLDASKIQSGRLELTKRTVAPKLLLKQAEALRDEADQHSLSLTITDETDGTDAVSADVERLRIVIMNLVQNGLRHTTAGGSVRVTSRRQDGVIRFTVTDTGEGIPAEYQERIFEKYFQIPARKSGGAGLGLYISREIVGAHAGEMGVVSTPGQGSTFWFTLPRIAA